MIFICFYILEVFWFTNYNTNSLLLGSYKCIKYKSSIFKYNSQTNLKSESLKRVLYLIYDHI